MLLVALLASLSVHFPVYEALGVLGDYFHEHEAADSKPMEPVEIEFAPTESVQEVADRKSAKDPSKLEPLPAPKPPEPQAQEQVPLEAKQAPPKETYQRQAIEQRSPDPSVRAPDDARFVAEENRKVEEETVARVRNYQRDDPSTQLSMARSGPEEEPGDSDEQDTEDLKERKGDETRTATAHEVESKREIPAQPTSTASEGQQPEGSTPPAGETIPSDAAGTIPVAPGSPGERSIRRIPNLRVGWQAFESTFGADKLVSEYESFVAQRRSKARGSNRQKEWKEFRSAIENFVPNVQPGNQTALNAAASPFASYLAAVHRRLHREFADRFLANLPTGEPLFNDYNLRTKLEVILNRDGSVFRVGVVETSGFMPYDHGAYSAVMRGQPYPPAPGSILSGDGRVYLHWAFYRNERQCGTFNAEPYILPNPPGAPARKAGPLQDSLEWGGVIPKTAEPAGDGSHSGSDTSPSDAVPASPAPKGSPSNNDSKKTPEKESPSVPKIQNGSGLG